MKFLLSYEYFLVELAFPDIRAMGFFNLQKLQNGFRIDTEANHAMNFGGDPYNYGVFYDKGEINSWARGLIESDSNLLTASSIIRMFQHALGEEIFREALNLYLTTK